MKTLIIYYSYTGHTKEIAEDLASKESADIEEIKEAKRRGKFSAYVGGCFAAIRGKACVIRPIKKDWNAYERIVVLAPIWAGNPAPAANAIWSKLPSGKKISVKMVSGSGKSDCRERIEKLIAAQGCKLESFEDIKK